jgi:hypothetical protein
VRGKEGEGECDCSREIWSVLYIGFLSYTHCGWKTEEKTLCGRPGYRWEHKIKMDIRR